MVYHDNNDNGDNDKLQTALVLGVELKNGPEHRIHIVTLLYKSKRQRPSRSAELCVKNSSVHLN